MEMDKQNLELKKSPSPEAKTPPDLRLESFSGPLDLLLRLIKEQKMDILKIDIHQITLQYVSWIKKLSHPDLENVGDFIRMACRLLYIKSRSLLPKEEEEGEDEEELKKKLSRLLINYQRHQVAGNLLYKRALLGRDCFASQRKLRFKDEKKEQELQIDQEKGRNFLILSYGSYRKMKASKKDYQIKEPAPSLLQHLKNTMHIFKEGARLKLKDLLFSKKGQFSSLLSFLTCLELSKLGVVNLFQKECFSPIDIFVKKSVSEKDMQALMEEENQSQNLSEVRL